jgi:molybdopterin molybdotransferase
MMKTVVEALSRILSSITSFGLKKTDILSALGRVLGEDIYADMNIPSRNNSAMDGYAVHFQDTQGAPEEIRLYLMLLKTSRQDTFPTRVSIPERLPE